MDFLVKYHLEHATGKPFSPAVQVGPFLFVSGQASVDAQGAVIADTFEGEFRRSMENVRRILESAGTDFSRVVQVRSYVRDPAYIKEYNALYREYFSEPFPARSTLTNCLTNLHFEIDCIALIGQASGEDAENGRDAGDV